MLLLWNLLVRQNPSRMSRTYTIKVFISNDLFSSPWYIGRLSEFLPLRSNSSHKMTHPEVRHWNRKSIFLGIYRLAYHFFSWIRWLTTPKWSLLPVIFWTGRCSYQFYFLPVGGQFFVRLSCWHRLLPESHRCHWILSF